MDGLAQVSSILQSRKRALLVGVAAVLALVIAVNLVLRQRLRAAPDITPAPATQVLPVAVEQKEAVQENKATPGETPTPKPVDASAAPSPAPPSPEQTLRAQVKPLWERGKYAEAMALVKEFLIDHPDSTDALAWKRKISAAQAAESALK